MKMDQSVARQKKTKKQQKKQQLAVILDMYVHAYDFWLQAIEYYYYYHHRSFIPYVIVNTLQYKYVLMVCQQLVLAARKSLITELIT